jgi:hypothetical protein
VPEGTLTTEGRAEIQERKAENIEVYANVKLYCKQLQHEIFVMNQTIFTLLSSSCFLYLFVLTSHAAIAKGKPSVATIITVPAHQVASTVASTTKSSATQTTETLVVRVNPRVFSLDANGDTVGDVAIAKFGCDCSSCRALALQMLQTGKLTL